MIKSVLIFLSLVAVPNLLAESDAVLRNFLENRLHGEAYHGDTKCATRYQLPFVLGSSSISPDLMQLYKQAMPADTTKQHSLISPGGHFRLSWDETGFDAVPPADISGNGIPDFIDSAAAIFDLVWTTEIDIMGYHPPPGLDGSPVKVYKIYFSNLDYYGLTYFDKKIPNIPQVRYTSYMELDNDFSGFYSPGLAGLRVTAAHEFHHAIQLGYNISAEADFFFYEMTSTWIEDRLYPEINDYYQYLPYFFKNVSNNNFTEYTENSTATLYPYGNSIYLIMLDRKYGSEIVHKVWDNILVKSALDALMGTLSASPYNQAWQESLNEYGVWLYYTGSRNRSGEFFPDAAQYPEVTVRADDRINFSGNMNSTINIEGHSNRFLEINGLNAGALDVLVSTSGFPHGGVRFADFSSESAFFPLNRLVTDYTFVNNKNVFIITNAADDAKNFTIKISSPVEGEIAISNNPVILTEGYQEVQFKVPENSEIYIFSLSGLLVAKMEKQSAQIRTWDMTNQQGKQIASGVYFWLVKAEGVEELNKFSVIR